MPTLDGLMPVADETERRLAVRAVGVAVVGVGLLPERALSVRTFWPVLPLLGPEIEFLSLPVLLGVLNCPGSAGASSPSESWLADELAYPFVALSLRAPILSWSLSSLSLVSLVATAYGDVIEGDFVNEAGITPVLLAVLLRDGELPEYEVLPGRRISITSRVLPLIRFTTLS